MHRPLIATAIALVLASSAWAVSKGGTLFVKTKDAKVFEKADLKAKVKGLLQRGDKVIWEGADHANKQLHKVKTDKFEGYTLQQNLTPNEPQPETGGDGKTIDAQAFASSGAATKALSEASLKYAQQKKTPAELLKGISTDEGIAATIDAKAAAEFNAKQTGGGK